MAPLSDVYVSQVVFLTESQLEPPMFATVRTASPLESCGHLRDGPYLLIHLLLVRCPRLGHWPLVCFLLAQVKAAGILKKVFGNNYKNRLCLIHSSTQHSFN